LFVSRSEEELKKRVIYLVQSLEREAQDPLRSISSPQSCQTQAQLDDKFNQLMKEAEEKATEAMKNLTLKSVIRYANHGLEAEEIKPAKQKES